MFEKCWYLREGKFDQTGVVSVGQSGGQELASGTMRIEVDREVDGRWIAEIGDLPGVMAYGGTQADAIAKAKALALRAMADRLEHGESIPELTEVFEVAA